MANDEPVDSLAGLGEFAVIDRLVSGSPASRRPSCSAPATTPPSSSRRRRQDRRVHRHARRGQALPAGLVDAARHRPQGHRAERRRHRGHGCRARRRSSSRSVRRVTPPPAQALELADGMWQEAGAVRRGHRRRRSGQRPAVGDLGDRARRSRRPCTGAAGRSAGRVTPLAVAGELGRSAAGYHAVAQRHSTASTSCGVVTWCRSRPTGRVASRPTAGATAMTDVSDGLVADLGHIADASGVGIDVSTAALAADRDALCRGGRRIGCRSVGVGARRRGGPCPRRDVPRHAAGRLARHRHGDRRPAAGAGRRRHVARKSGLAVISVSASR